MDDRRDARQGEINLIDIIFYCLEKWRFVVACMLTVAVVTGGYKYQEVEKSNQLIRNNILPEKSVDLDEKEEIVGEEDEESKERAIKSYEQAIRESEYDLKLKENYMRDSVVMHMDPYHVSIGTLSYYVEEGEHKTGILAAYRAFVSGGGMADKLYMSDDDILIEDIQYLLSFADSSSKEYEIDNENRLIFETEASTSVFQIQIRMPDSEKGKIYLKYAEDAVAEYAIKMQSEIGEHKIKLLSSVLGEISDIELQKYQSDIRTVYAASVRNLQILRTEVKSIENSGTTENAGNIHEEESSQPVQETVNAKSQAIKFAVLGMIAGAALACFILIISYLLGGRLQDTEIFQAEFGMPMLGMVRTSGTEKRLFGFIDTWIFKLRGGLCARVSFEEQIKMAAANLQAEVLQDSMEGNLKKVMIAGTVSDKDAAVLCERLISEVDGVSLSVYTQMIFQSSSLKELENYDGIFFIEKKRVSNCRFIEQEKKMASNRNVKVLGTIVLC